jgi:hypothetical protein
VKEADKEFWSWIFRENDGPNHPLKISNGGKAQIQHGRMLIVAGSLQGHGKKERSLRIPAGIDFIFVPADNIVCTEADTDGNTDQDLINNANNEISGGTGKVLVNRNPQRVDLLEPHVYRLNIQNCIAGTGKNGMGEGCTKGTPPGETRAASACQYAIISANALKPLSKRRFRMSGDIIRITGRGDIDVTYKVDINESNTVWG